MGEQRRGCILIQNSSKTPQTAKSSFNSWQAPHDVAETSAIDVSAPAQVMLPTGAVPTWQHSHSLRVVSTLERRVFMRWIPFFCLLCPPVARVILLCHCQYS